MNSNLEVHDDPRVTPMGRVLHRQSMDELPQFLNMLMGNMSLVSPRSEEEWIVELYNENRVQRLLVKPGLTGPMQNIGRDE